MRHINLKNFQPYVKLNYVPVRGLKDYCDMIRLVSGALDKDQKAADYVEATVFSKNEAVIMTGEYTDCVTDDDRRKVKVLIFFPIFFNSFFNFLKSLQKFYSSSFIISVKHANVWKKHYFFVGSKNSSPEFLRVWGIKSRDVTQKYIHAKCARQH